ncbi:MAG: SufD family Fe-S cluster assembly protein [Candidatus Gracilibacteria bacterium]
MHHLTEFGTKLPRNLTIKTKEHRILVADTLNTTDIILEENSSLTLVAVLTKGWTEKQFLNFYLDGENATLNFIAMIIAKGSNEFPFETISNHEIPRTSAYYKVRGAMFDNSKVYYKGNLIIKKGAQITDTHLAHHTLMLSRNAKVETIPSLEILADDVKAGHAATIGRVDEEMLFYFQSRGLDKKTATTSLTRAFMHSDLEHIPDADARMVVAEMIEKELNVQ